MQPADGTKVEIEVFDVQLEALRDQSDRLFQLHQRQANVLNLLSAEGLGFEPADGLAVHQFPNELDEAQDQLHNRTLDIVGVGIPTHGWGCRSDTADLSAGPFRACGGAFRARFRAAFLHALDFFFGGPPITLRICLIRSCGRHGLVMTTSQPAFLALSECPLMAWPVSATTGMFFVATSSFSRRVASHPSIIGMDRSIRMRSGFRFFAFSISSTPFCPSATLKPQNFRYSPYISLASAKSSTTRTSGSSLLFDVAFMSNSFSEHRRQCQREGRTLAEFAVHFQCPSQHRRQAPAY